MWSAEQNLVLYENAKLGAKACRDILYKELGVRRTVEATRKHMQRLGISTKREVNPCPLCGSMLNIEKSGYCSKCHLEFLAAQTAIKQQHSLRDYELEGEARRRYAAERKRKSRAQEL